MPTVADLLTVYEREFLPTKAPTTQHAQRNLYIRIRADLGDVPLDELTPKRLREWRDRLRQQYQPGTTRCYLEGLSAALTVAVNELEWMEDQPMRRVKKPQNAPGRTRVLSEEEQVRLLEACKAVRSPYLYPVVVLLLYTGCRKGEIEGLTWPDVDFEHRCLRLRQTKNGDRRVIGLVGEALAVLQRLYETRRLTIPWVFACWDGKKPVDIDTTWQRMKSRIGLGDLHLHDLRHTAASRLAMSGASLLEIAAILGHRQMKMVQRYSHFTNDHSAGVLERMAQRYPVHPPRPEGLGPEAVE